jgi:hypothetical protein
MRKGTTIIVALLVVLGLLGSAHAASVLVEQNLL